MEHLCAQKEVIGTIKTKVENLERWQGVQNGSLQRMDEKIGRIHTGIIGILGGVVVSVVLLLINIIIQRGG